jgi:hypothetical protein
MVAAETFAGLNIHSILVTGMGIPLQACTVNGADAYPGMAMTWETATDVDPAEDDDAAFAGVLVPDGNHDLDAVMADNQRASVAPPGTYCWVLFVTSGGALTKGVKVSVSGATDGYFVLNASTALVRGEFIMDSDGGMVHADVAAVSIIMIKVESGGIQAAA